MEFKSILAAQCRRVGVAERIYHFARFFLTDNPMGTVYLHALLHHHTDSADYISIWLEQESGFKLLPRRSVFQYFVWVASLLCHVNERAEEFFWSAVVNSKRKTDVNRSQLVIWQYSCSEEIKYWFTVWRRASSNTWVLKSPILILQYKKHWAVWIRFC